MKPEIESYLREHGSQYTRLALRGSLIQAGHAPDEVDAALDEWHRMQGEPGETEVAQQRGRFWMGVWGLHLAGWIVVLVWVGLRGSDIASGFGSIGVVILAVAMLIGVAISGLIGRLMVRSTGVLVALVIPAVSAILLAGSCVGMLGGFNG